jgi:hydroxymethylpyrimidine/phosphomethylpyrimidine kinase
LKKRAEILTIAGFDPSGGAGILADIKTFEKHRCLGLAVQTANTIQTAESFVSVNWIEEEIILQQLQELLKFHNPTYVKIGLLPSLTLLRKIIDQFKEKGLPKIIWDPVLSSSTGFDFEQNLNGIEDLLKDIYLLTPNWNEIQQILAGDPIESAKELSKYCHIYLKGGHREDEKGKDLLFRNGKMTSYNARPGMYYSKHGSGCVLSSALAANLANGYPLNKGILRAKRYIEHFLNSNPSELGYHLR